MPIRAALRPLYPPDWRAISHRVRFVRERGRCQECGRHHGQQFHRLPDGRCWDGAPPRWLDRYGNPAPDPTLLEMMHAHTSRVWLSCAHLDNDPTNNSDNNLAALCQRCHLRWDADYHRLQRKITHMHRRALGDLFEGEYAR